MPKYFEELEVGWTDTYGSKSLTKDEIIRFAEKFDPQPFHVDEEKAKDSLFGGIIASGLHTLCLSTRIYTDNFLHEIPLVAGRGLDDVRFHAPVYPGDSLSIEVEVLDKKDSPRDSSWGDVQFGLSTINQDNEVVMSLVDLSIIERRTDQE
jgi:acyl dehydratase